MRSEEAVPTDQRFLVCNYSFSDRLMKRVKEDVVKFMKDREKTDLHHRFINWQPQKNELAVLTMYAYADMTLPKHFDTIFQLNNPKNYVHTSFSITQVVINGWMAIEEIEHGHKHIAVLAFDQEIPKIVNLLSDFSITDLTPHSLQLGFCNQANFEAIQKYLENKSMQ